MLKASFKVSRSLKVPVVNMREVYCIVDVYLSSIHAALLPSSLDPLCVTPSPYDLRIYPPSAMQSPYIHATSIRAAHM